MSESPESSPSEGVGRGVKIFVILLTVVTVAAFAVFSLQLVSKMLSPSKAASWPNRLYEVAGKLQEAGLKQQAVQQYIRYLETAKVDLARRAAVSETIGALYREMDNCPEALVWFYSAQVAAQQPGETLQSHIAACLKTLREP